MFEAATKFERFIRFGVCNEGPVQRQRYGASSVTKKIRYVENYKEPRNDTDVIFHNLLQNCRWNNFYI